jgi:hypothetical protein
MTRSLTGCIGIALGLTLISVAPASAFWQRGQVIMCADATSAAERQRHRCDELLGYVDPGWPALGLGSYREYHERGKLNRGPHPGLAPGSRTPTRRLG